MKQWGASWTELLKSTRYDCAGGGAAEADDEGRDDADADPEGCESEGREGDGWAAVVEGCEAPPILQPAEHDLDAVAAFVSALIVFDRQRAGVSARNARFDALFLKRVPELFRIVAPIGLHSLRLWQIIEQSSSARVIANLACSDEETQPDRPGSAQQLPLTQRTRPE
ncbi:hypothetical protein MB02_10695 [Croceicoccus estronivorus]|nr:hypothetical protein MB02_10695 [Croceicoccus estronivorus]